MTKCLDKIRLAIVETIGYAIVAHVVNNALRDPGEGTRYRLLSLILGKPLMFESNDGTEPT